MDGALWCTLERCGGLTCVYHRLMQANAHTHWTILCVPPCIGIGRGDILDMRVLFRGFVAVQHVHHVLLLSVTLYFGILLLLLWSMFQPPPKFDCFQA